MGTAECRRIERLQTALDEANLIGVAISAICSHRDGVVDRQACADRYSTSVRHVEVRSSHVGMGVDPDVWRITAGVLAAP